MTDPVLPRPSIPAEMKRRVLVEAGHRCAIHTCRYIEVEIHHIVPWSEGQAHEYENLIALCANCHRRADRGDIDRKALRTYKANLRTAHDKFSPFELDMLLELYRQPRAEIPGGLIGGLPLPRYLQRLVARIDEAGFLEWHDPSPEGPKILVGPFNVLPSVIRITQAGLDYVESLAVDHGD